MTKLELKALAEKYNMGLYRSDEITQQVIGYYVRTRELIPELDAIIDDQHANMWTDRPNVVAERRLLGSDEYIYILVGPSNWFDLSGLIDPKGVTQK